MPKALTVLKILKLGIKGRLTRIMFKMQNIYGEMARLSQASSAKAPNMLGLVRHMRQKLLMVSMGG
jgi:hypothetical protein